MIRIGICDDLVEQLQIQEEMVRNIVCRLGLNTEIKCRVCRKLIFDTSALFTSENKMSRAHGEVLYQA